MEINCSVKKYFFLTKSVFEQSTKNSSNISSKFLLKSILIKLQHRDKINPHIIFFLEDALEDIKVEFGDKFNGISQLGKNMFCSVFNPKIKGNLNMRILSYSTDLDGEIDETQ